MFRLSQQSGQERLVALSWYKTSGLNTNGTRLRKCGFNPWSTSVKSVTSSPKKTFYVELGSRQIHFTLTKFKLFLSCPFIVKLYWTWRDNVNLFLLMEYVPGKHACLTDKIRLDLIWPQTDLDLKAASCLPICGITGGSTSPHPAFMRRKSSTPSSTYTKKTLFIAI